LAKPEREARLPSAETRFLEQGPKLVLGEESGKQSGDVPPGAGIGPKRVTGQTWERHGRPPLHGSHSERLPGCANATLHNAESPLCHAYERRPEKSSTCRAPLRLKMAYAAESRRACRPCMRAVLGHEDCLVWEVASSTRTPGRPGSGRWSNRGGSRPARCS
jgi:hypothetical protein